MYGTADCSASSFANVRNVSSHTDYLRLCCKDQDTHSRIDSGSGHMHRLVRIHTQLIGKSDWLAAIRQNTLCMLYMLVVIAMQEIVCRHYIADARPVR
jgi:hypothetical protein